MTTPATAANREHTHPESIPPCEACERQAAQQALADAVERVRRLENLRTRVEHMGLCSQTHHEYVMMAARDIAAAPASPVVG